MAADLSPEMNGTDVTVDFVRHRNVLLAQADLSALFTDYYLHLADHNLRYTPEQDAIFKHALAVFALHCAARPRGEHIAWTLNFQQPRLNVFLAGDNEDGTVTGRLFTENVCEAEHNVFYSDVVPRRGAERRRSVVHFDGADMRQAVETYYVQSEQQPARCFQLAGDEYALLVAHPDFDLAWFATVNAGNLGARLESETLARIERRNCQWQCGCNQKKILGAIAPSFRTEPEDLFGGGESIRVQCPRCAATHVITREAMEAYLVQTKKDGA